MARSLYGASLKDPWEEDRNPVKYAAKSERVNRKVDKLRTEHRSPAQPPRRTYWDVDHAYEAAEDAKRGKQSAGTTASKPQVKKPDARANYKPQWAHQRNKAVASKYELAGQKNHALVEREYKNMRNGKKVDDEYATTLAAYEDAFYGSRGGRGRTKQQR